MEYTLRIAAKRQVTLPEEIVTALNLKKGDEFGIIVHNPSDIRLVPYTRVRKDLITPEVEKILRKRRKEIERGQPMASLQAVLKQASTQRAGYAQIEAKTKASKTGVGAGRLKSITG